MNDPDNPQEAPSDTGPATEDTTREEIPANPLPEGETRQAFEDLGEAFRRAWKAGTSDAKRTAEDAIPRAKEEFTKGVHELAWGAAYLASFGVTLAREVAPDCVDRGWAEGTAAGRKAAENFTERSREKEERAEPSEGSPSGEDDDPASGMNPALA